MESKSVFQFVPLKSFVHGSFWHKLAEVKLNIDKLNDSAKNVSGFFSNSCSRNTANLLEIDCTAFNQEFKAPSNSFPSCGILLNKNTVEEFKTCDKNDIIKTLSQKHWEEIFEEEFLVKESQLAFFILLSFADLKQHNYYYWFAFPAFKEPTIPKNNEPLQIAEALSSSLLDNLSSKYLNSANIFFILSSNGNIFNLKDKIKHSHKEENFRNDDLDQLYFCYSDPSEAKEAGWILRQYIAYLIIACPVLLSKTLKFISIRQENRSLEKSLIFEVTLPEKQIDIAKANWVGWETNSSGKFAPRVAEMGKSMDPLKLAESSVNLNLKLMKWRILPDLNLKIIADTKCLLLGAGTLGCGVARTLMAWGVNNITFVDYGHVSFSNPVRQTLFLHEDALNGGKKKGLTAAKRLKEIHPGINSKGYSMQIPMPGHPIGQSLMTKTLEDLATLKKLVDSHDAIFLLTDSRESRWLPTLLGVINDKIVINAALGFDSYLVMRHGSKKDVEIKVQEVIGLKSVAGNKLGCYFCNDVVAPRNSMKDRTLDQQCTVTRPAVSNMASSMAAELLVALLQHENRELAPAYYQSSSMSNEEQAVIPEGILGIIPHSIRGTLSSFEHILPATEKFSQCIACSQKVLSEYKERGDDFLLQVFESAKFLEDLTGISEMQEIDEKVIQFDDSDFVLSDSE